MDSNYQRIYTGNFIVVQLIKERLNNIGVSPIIKDETESGRLAGFGPSVVGQQQVFVHENELDKSVPIVEEVLSTIEV